MFETGDEEFTFVVLPFSIGVFGTFDTNVYVSVNGRLSLYGANYAHTNYQLPDTYLPSVSMLAYYDDLNLTSSNHIVAYQVLGSVSGSRNVTFEWVTEHWQFRNQVYHFTATFEEAQPGIVTYRYYTISDKGRSATVGAQNLLRRNQPKFTQYTFDTPNSVRDRTFVRLNTTGAGSFTTGAVEMADVFPNAEIIGNDLSAIQPSWVPPNVKFEIDDVESSWVGTKKFDYIFVRHMLVAIADWPKLVKNVYKHLDPGGWAEFQDLNSEYYSDDGTYTEEHATRKWNKQFVDACEAMGRTGCPGLKLQDWVKDAGFQRITHQRFKCPVGPWARDPHHREVGMLNLIQTLDGLEAFSLKLFCDVLGKTKEEVLVMLTKVRSEVKSNTFHAMFDHHVVYGQKPEDIEDEQADE
ncbi:methyltransferase domain-containing protein [Colletotrichum karsti]|uniref:Methyltransferase domain-containing protein n=1 Tax=Colletotrichum karsti TaxID=1095194 RepID=A0A9P6LKT5_9PEZI|nr:methyltransferase domain-containing protein [Colletotrichum karsti]KAF9877078.1 methyltransferase domain-containing protein [Colletotrichum karsti]